VLNERIKQRAAVYSFVFARIGMNLGTLKTLDPKVGGSNPSRLSD